MVSWKEKIYAKGKGNEMRNDGQCQSKIINYKICKLAEIDRHQEFVAADFNMWNLKLESSLRILFSLSLMPIHYGS